jgi:hypothetical protein
MDLCSASRLHRAAHRGFVDHWTCYGFPRLASGGIDTIMFCKNCGAEAPTGQQYCGKCGSALGSAAPAVTAVKPGSADLQKVLSYLKKCLSRPEGFIQNVVQLVILYFALQIVCWAGWGLFAIPGSWLAFIQPGYCADLAGQEGTFKMFLCSSKVAAEVFSGPLFASIIIFLLRKPILKGLAALAIRIPAEARFLVFPVACTCFFAITWSSIHSTTGDSVGITSQRTFPALVGLLTYVSFRYGDKIQSGLKPFLAWRDSIPFSVRLILTIVIPFALSLAMTYQLSVTDPSEKEQWVVLLTMVLAYLALAPNRGASAQPAGTAAQPTPA